MKFNENLKFLRKKENLTQEELAEKLNVSRQSITKWESGGSLPDIETIKEISYLFSVSIDTLIGDIENRKPNKLKKKINDIGWFIFGLTAFAFIINLSISNFIINILPNIDYAIGIIIINIILTFIIIIKSIKSYLLNNNEKIINTKNTLDGKKERRNYFIKKYSLRLLYSIIFCIIINLPASTENAKYFLDSILNDLFIWIFLDIVLFIAEYKKINKIYKDFNN